MHIFPETHFIPQVNINLIFQVTTVIDCKIWHGFKESSSQMNGITKNRSQWYPTVLNNKPPQHCLGQQQEHAQTHTVPTTANQAHRNTTLCRLLAERQNQTCPSGCSKSWHRTVQRCILRPVLDDFAMANPQPSETHPCFRLIPQLCQAFQQ